MMEPIIVVVGPTGVGKTKLSVELAKKLDAEIINADSMQVYQRLDIGTAKIKEKEKEGIPHHLFDIVDVDKCYTVFDYQKDCREKIEEITSRGKRVIMVGGTGLYIKAALCNYEFKEGTTQNDYEEYSNIELLEKIKEFDPTCNIHVNNRKRLVRTYNKIENEETLSKKGNDPLYPFVIIGLTTSRDILYDKINKRVDEMIKDGLLDEVKELYDQNIRTKAIDTGIGYKELYRYFDNELSLKESIDLIKKNSRHYAKRQYTFFNHQLPVEWIETNYHNFEETIDKVITFIQKIRYE